MTGPRDTRLLKLLAIIAICGSAAVLWPFAPWVILAMWAAVFARPTHVALTRKIGGRPHLAALLVISTLAVVIVPIVVLVTLLVVDAVHLVERLMSSDRAQELLQMLVSADDEGARHPADLVGVLMTQADRAWAIAQQVAGTAARLLVGLVIFIAGTYAFLIEGDRWYAWLVQQWPTSTDALDRLASAFVETGRGLFLGILGAGLAQALLATIVYLVVGVPQPFALGLLTFVFSVVPIIGTSAVWIPVAIGLALSGRFGAAAGVAIAGVLLIGTIDNIIRPYLARRGHLQLPTFVVLVAMFGGVVLFGGWGLFVGPLILRFSKELLAIVHEQRVTADPDSAVRGSRLAIAKVREHA